MWSKGDKVWTIGINHPSIEQEEINYIKIKNGAIATSNRVFRSWRQDGEVRHHLLNGQNGEVINSHILQTTVVTNSLCLAEVVTKLCFLLSEEDVHKWFAQHNIQGACYIVKENKSSYWLKEGEKIHVS